MGKEAGEVSEQTMLSSLCVGRREGLAPCFSGMRVKHLRGFTRESLMDHVRKDGGQA